ncbi:MAG: putative rane protein [Herbinix sp.]|jgi:inhibitor of the pro-sigma K processing machinery|nr:putative rane protein [Herbinix sp.]
MSIENVILIGIIAACILYIGVCVVRRRPELILNFVLRASAGTAGICLINLALQSQGYGVSIAVNGVSVLTNGLLGLPGFILLFGLAVYYSFA